MAPFWLYDLYAECEMGGTPTGVKVTATDRDGQQYNKITFSIVEDWANLYFEASLYNTDQRIVDNFQVCIHV